MGFVNAKIARLKPSETLAVKTKANELRAAGREVLDLSTGEPDIDTPQHIRMPLQRRCVMERLSIRQ